MKREAMRRSAIHLSVMAIVLFAATAMIFFAPTAAWACPSCKEALAAGDPERAHLVRGFFWSILFMLCTPFAILTGFGTYAYVLVRRAGRAARANEATAQQEHEAKAEEREPVEVG